MTPEHHPSILAHPVTPFVSGSFGPIDSIDAVVVRLGEATRTLDELVPATIAGLEARVLDFTAEPNPAPRPEDAILRTEEGGVGGWGPAAEGRVWLLGTPRGIMLLSEVCGATIPVEGKARHRW